LIQYWQHSFPIYLVCLISLLLYSIVILVWGIVCIVLPS